MSPSNPLLCPGLDSDESCQCNDDCSSFGDCCSDYDELCRGGSTGGGDVSDADLASIAEILLNLEINNGNQFVELDFQGSTSSCGPDNAPDP
jgi:hypothetical protein